MANYFTSTIFIFLIISQTSSARPLNGGFHPDSLAATESARNIALPGGEHGGASPASPSEKVSPSEPCESMESKKIVGRRYGPLFLSMLPKGTTVPPSGPSGGINNINN